MKSVFANQFSKFRVVIVITNMLTTNKTNIQLTAVTITTMQLYSIFAKVKVKHELLSQSKVTLCSP